MQPIFLVLSWIGTYVLTEILYQYTTGTGLLMPMRRAWGSAISRTTILLLSPPPITSFSSPVASSSQPPLGHKWLVHPATKFDSATNRFATATSATTATSAHFVFNKFEAFQEQPRGYLELLFGTDVGIIAVVTMVLLLLLVACGSLTVRRHLQTVQKSMIAHFLASGPLGIAAFKYYGLSILRLASEILTVIESASFLVSKLLAVLICEACRIVANQERLEFQISKEIIANKALLDQLEDLRSQARNKDSRIESLETQMGLCESHIQYLEFNEKCSDRKFFDSIVSTTSNSSSRSTSIPGAQPSGAQPSGPFITVTSSADVGIQTEDPSASVVDQLKIAKSEIFDTTRELTSIKFQVRQMESARDEQKKAVENAEREVQESYRENKALKASHKTAIKAQKDLLQSALDESKALSSQLTLAEGAVADSRRDRDEMEERVAGVERQLHELSQANIDLQAANAFASNADKESLKAALIEAAALDAKRVAAENAASAARRRIIELEEQANSTEERLRMFAQRNIDLAAEQFSALQAEQNSLRAALEETAYLKSQQVAADKAAGEVLQQRNELGQLFSSAREKLDEYLLKEQTLFARMAQLEADLAKERAHTKDLQGSLAAEVQSSRKQKGEMELELQSLTKLKDEEIADLRESLAKANAFDQDMDEAFNQLEAEGLLSTPSVDQASMDIDTTCQSSMASASQIAAVEDLDSMEAAPATLPQSGSAPPSQQAVSSRSAESDTSRYNYTAAQYRKARGQVQGLIFAYLQEHLFRFDRDEVMCTVAPLYQRYCGDVKEGQSVSSRALYNAFVASFEMIVAMFDEYPSHMIADLEEWFRSQVLVIYLP